MATIHEKTTEAAALALEVDGDGIAWLTFDRRGSRVNLLTTPVMSRLDALLGAVEEGARAGRIRALIVQSGKPGTFIAGADVEEIGRVRDAAEGTAKSRQGQRIFRRLELLTIPTMAAIDGVCLGGGTELALACRNRLASDRADTRIGLPEVRLGILPGFGGTVRLPRLLGLRAALELIVSGKPISARRALRIGLVDEVVPTTMLRDRVKHFARERIEKRHVTRRKRPALTRLLERTPPGRRLLLQLARRQVRKETGGNYPAPLAAIDTLSRTVGRPLDPAFELEARTLGELIATDVCKNLVHVFRLTESAKKAGPLLEPRSVDVVGVLGAGVMGGGIAQLLAYHGLGVRLKDVQARAIGQALHHARELFDAAVRRGRLERRAAEEAFGRIAPTLDYSGFARVDVVIEAVVERMEVKQQVLHEVEARVASGGVLTSNTSSLSIQEMQKALERPADFCGMHFFNPVERMPLVEVVRAPDTSDGAVATIFALARRLGKTPLEVKDGPGFLVNRLLGPYLNEAGWLLADGASIEAIDRALTAFGMPMGPLRLLDEIGLDVAAHAAGVMHEALGERFRPALPLLALRRTARLGRKGGRGFYRYEGGKSKEADAAIYAELRDSVPASRRELPRALIQERTVLAMVNEAARALEDGIVGRAADVDLAMILGTGFPPFRGGLLRYADALGLPAILGKLGAFERERGPRFQPAPLLRERAVAGRGFYD
ncbi:MAG: enoyl-CoA hydratase/isomerase family protein [Gemmatimonadetes bacterium]|nr:enoyl-CoA hydratase/isomerase family protein [Gemmatimonadota bacterium]